jgi:hypothetical protein
VLVEGGTFQGLAVEADALRAITIGPGIIEQG